MPPATATPPRAGTSPPDSVVALAPHDLGLTPRRDPPLAGGLPLPSSSGEPPRRGSGPVPHADDDARTHGSAEFFLGEPAESSDTLQRTAFTYNQLLELYAQRHGKLPAEHTMVHTFGEHGVETWGEVWCAAVDRFESQESLVPGYDAPPTSSLIDDFAGRCTPQSKDTTVYKIAISESHSSELHHNSMQHDGGKESSQGLYVGSDRGSVLLKQQNGGEEVRQGVDVGSTRSHPPKNTTEHSEKNAVCGGQTLLDTCFTCGKDGQLLKCRSCFISCHSCCFGPFVPSARLNDDHLYCPVCFCLKAEKTLSEARKQLSGFMVVLRKPVEKQHCEKSTGYQQTAANSEDHLNGCCTSELSSKDEEPGHEKRNDASDACPEVVAIEKTTTSGPNPGDGKTHEVENNSSSHQVPHSSQNRLSPTIAIRNIEAKKYNVPTNSAMPRARRVRLQEEETIASPGKASGRHDQFMHSPTMKTYCPSPPECHFVPSTSSARGTPASTRRQGGSSTGRRINWTPEEEEALREGVAKYLAEHADAAAGKRNIKWRQILEDGKDSFDPVRVPENLRWKWRNMNQG